MRLIARKFSVLHENITGNLIDRKSHRQDRTFYRQSIFFIETQLIDLKRDNFRKCDQFEI